MEGLKMVNDSPYIELFSLGTLAVPKVVYNVSPHSPLHTLSHRQTQSWLLVLSSEPACIYSSLNSTKVGGRYSVFLRRMQTQHWQNGGLHCLSAGYFR